jgi:hypothetical protein
MSFTTYFIDYLRAVVAKCVSKRDQCAAPHQILFEYANQEE